MRSLLLKLAICAAVPLGCIVYYDIGYSYGWNAGFKYAGCLRSTERYEWKKCTP